MPTIVAATRGGLVLARDVDAGGRNARTIVGGDARCLTADPLSSDTLYAGLGRPEVLRSDDRGATWEPVACPGGRLVRSLAVSRSEPGAVYAGTSPVGVFVSRDRAATWQQLARFARRHSWWWFSPAEKPYRAYVAGIALSPIDPRIVLAGIELGGVLRSDDSGRTWSGHRPGASRDCHSLVFHAAHGACAYQAGGTRGGVLSLDGGRTWKRPPGLDRSYGLSVAADPERPEIAYLSAAHALTAHGPRCDAAIFRLEGSRWTRARLGLPQRLTTLPVIVTTPGRPASSTPQSATSFGVRPTTRDPGRRSRSDSPGASEPLSPTTIARTTPPDPARHRRTSSPARIGHRGAVARAATSRRAVHRSSREDGRQRSHHRSH